MGVISGIHTLRVSLQGRYPLAGMIYYATIPAHHLPHRPGNSQRDIFVIYNSD